MSDFLHVILDVFGVGGDDGAVVVVVGVVKLIPLVKEGGVEDKVHFLFDEPRYMSVRQLCRIAFRLTGDGLDTELIDFAVGNRGEHYPETQLREEGEPERVILVHI